MIAYGAPRDPTAVVWRRILAFAIDFTLISAAMGSVLWIGWQDNVVRRPASEVRCAVADGTRPSGVDVPESRVFDEACIEWGDEVLYLPDEDAAAVSSRMWLVGLTLITLDLVVLQGLAGGSLGKLTTRLRVVRADGAKAGVGRGALRTLVLFVDMLCCFLPGAVLVFSTKGHRRLGDMAATTFVVDRRDLGQPVVVAGLTAGYVEPSYPPPGYPQAGGPPAWGPPSGPGAPGTPTTPGSWGTPTAPSADGPIWDEARDTYIQFDRSTDRWVQWDEAGARWVPIDHQG